LLTSDPIYNKPYKPAIYINNTANNTNYYTYDPWTDSGTTNKPTHLGLNLSENTHGKFVCQIEDGGRTLNRNNINKGARLIIKVGKYAGQMTQVFSGLIREVADSRGSDRKDLYSLVGSSTSIRNNERVIYFVRQAAKLTDGLTIDIDDPAMKAVILLSEAYQSSRSVSPQSIGAEGSEGIINISNMITNSTVLNFIADVNIEFGEIQDAVNSIEEQSGSEFVVSSADIANLRYELRNIQGGKGFTIKNKTYRISGQDDDADDTMYLIKKNWKYSDSAYKDASYSNRVSGILGSEPDPILQNLFRYQPTAEGGTLSDDEVCQKFRPTHSRFLPGDIWIGLGQRADDEVVRPYRMRIADGTGSNPNSAAVIANIEFPQPNLAFPTNFQSPMNIMNEQYFMDSGGNIINEFTLDTNKDYWLCHAQVYFKAGTFPIHYAQIGYRNGTPVTPKYLGVKGTSSNSSLGTGWSGPTSGYPCLWYAFPRRRAMAIVMHDPKAIKNLGSGLITGGTIIESHLPSFPSIIKTKQAGYSYMANQLYYMAKPRANYAIPQVTAPNILPLPGDPIIISDTVLGFSTSGNKVVITRCGDMSLSWGSLDGSGFTYEAPTKLSINPVGNIPRYK
jgi:hypothetical protein